MRGECAAAGRHRRPAAGGAVGTCAAPEPFEKILARWLVLSEASNSINRCMGLPDLYPFVISDVTAQKLGLRA